MKVKRYKISQQGFLNSKATDPTKKRKMHPIPYALHLLTKHIFKYPTHKTQKIAIITHLPRTPPFFFPL
ncbi:hypothetical protein PRUPE_7G014700 [Prunus persica]|uniref:Uncharacterized protein n=1 Tax=Prunus persica TaxID=3760 RepID=A0A251N4Z6_PRUPE|nr:hypothetical protein PRUPE_7G014700 [Prunus persica]